MDNHTHSKENKFFNAYSEMTFAIVSGTALLLGIILENFTGFSYLAHIFYVISAFSGGFFPAIEAYHGLRHLEFDIDFLMIFAAIGAFSLDKYAEGAFLLFLFSLGHSLEHYAMNRAKKQITSLSDLTPPKATLKKGNDLVEVDVKELKLGDIVVVRPGSKIPVDGVVVDGTGFVNQAPITGESLEVEKIPIDKILLSTATYENIEESHKVFAGTINGDSLLEIKTLRLNEDSTLSRLIKLVNEAESKQSPTQLFTKKVEKYYVPLILILVVILCFAFLILKETPKESFYRAMGVLVAGSPCALAISTPSAILSAIARAAKERVLIKGGKALEIMGGLDAIAFDKTGTLTKGKPIVKSILNYNISIEELHEVLYVMELSSTHPLAKAVTKVCEEFINKDAIEPLDNVQNISGRGMVANYRNDKILVGNRELIDENNIAISKEIQDKILLLHDSGHTTILIAKNTEVVGLVSLIDEPRETSKQVIAELKKLGITRLAMLTGDNDRVAQSIGKDLGLTEIYGSLLPEDKLTIIDKLVSEYSEVAMIGDGTNDAPAMAHSSVGIAMGAAGSDVALETADVALLSDKIENLPFVIGLGRKSKQIIKQNLFISLGTILFLIPASIIGLTNMGITVFIHEGSTVLVVFNALRLLKYKNKIKFQDQEG